MAGFQRWFFEKNRNNREKGFALLIVIMVMLLVSFLAMQLAMDVQTETKVTFNVKNRMIGFFLAEAGVNLAIFRLLPDFPQDTDDEEMKTFRLGQVYEEFLPNGKVEYMAVNETGKIDLNSYPDELMRRFLEYHGVEPDRIEVIIDSLLDWRDNDDLHRMNGAEKDTYLGLEEPYISRNGLIEDPAEFFLIFGTEGLSDKFEAQNVFTVHNQGSKINFNSLTPEMLSFLTGGDKEKMQMYYDLQKEILGTSGFADVNARAILGEERFSQVGQYLIYNSSVNRLYHIVATGLAGYKNEENFSPKIRAHEKKRDGHDDQEDGQEKRYPGARISILVQMLGVKIQILSWKELNV